MTIQKIGVIGAGIAGLATAKTFLAEGYEVTVFEKQKNLGGVWEKSRTYPGLSSQNTGDTYYFSDYSIPASFPEWPTAEDIRNYLESYARHFGVIDKIRFQTEVVKVFRSNGTTPGWVVTVKAKDTNSEQTKEENYKFDFVVICNGMFSTPNIPALSGKEEFIASGGQVLHSTEFQDASILEDKRVIVVGCGKSASDIATLGATKSKECTLVFRQPTWKIPRFLLGVVNIKHLLLTRFTEAWFPYRQMGRWENFLHTLGRPLVWIFWRTLELILRLQFGLDRCGMLPEHPIDKVICHAHQEPPEFFKYIHSGKIQTIRTTISRFIAGGVELANGQKLEADVVIFGTGFTQNIPFLEEKYRELIVDQEGSFHLYRYLIHPEVPQMGFVGYYNSLYSTLTSEVGSWWLADYVKGYLSLPSPSIMHQAITTELNWINTQFSHSKNGGSCIYSCSLRYIEQLIKDMDTNNQLVIWKEFSQIMKIVDLSKFSKIRQELKSQRHKISNIDKKVAVTVD